MDDIARIRAFIKVVETGSFSAAARPQSSVSTVTRQIKSLEGELGVVLLNRSTRSLSLTDAGRRFYERVTALTRELDSVTSEVKSLQEDVKGVLHVTLRIAAGTTIVVPALPKLLARYPELEFDISLTDERRDLIADNIDVALWLGDMPNADIIARRLSPSRRIVCATPAYLQASGTPGSPQELRQHNCLVYTAPQSYRGHWAFTRQGTREEVEVRGSVRSDNGLILLSAALANVGVIIAHEWMVRNQLAEGKLVRLFDDYTVSPRSSDAQLYAVYPASRAHSRKVRVFIEFLVELFAPDGAKPRTPSNSKQ